MYAKKKKKTAAFYQFTNQIAMKNKKKNSKLHKTNINQFS
jgi:hypothetical protein